MKLRAAVVGVGYLGHFHAQKFRALVDGPFLNKIDFVGVCDLHAPQADKVAAAVGVQAFHRPEDLIGKVDLVTIATVTSSHFAMAKMFLQNRIHVNVEKPMTVTYAEAQELVELAAKHNLTLCVGHSERFNPVIREIKPLVGKAKYIELQRHAPFKSRGADVSVVHDLMIHDIDLAIALADSPVQVVSAQGGLLLTKTLDWARAELVFASGPRVFISVSRTAAQMTRSIKLVNSVHSIEGNLQTGDLSVASFAPEQTETPLKIETKNCGKGDNLLLETEAYFHAVLGEAPPIVTAQHGLQAMYVVEKVMELIGNPK